MSETSGKKIAVLGAGAVGCFFGGMLARGGEDVTLIGRAPHMDAIAREGLLIDGIKIKERVTLATATDVSAVSSADIVLYCVKTPDTETAAVEMQPFLKPGAVVLSMQNAVDNVTRIQKATGIEALATVVYVGASMSAPGVVSQAGRGDLILGHWFPVRPDSAGVPEIAAMWERCGVPCNVSDNIKKDLWIKMIMNCGGNAISALCRTQYFRIPLSAPVVEMTRRMFTESCAIARAEGVDFDDAAMHEAFLKLTASLNLAISSTAQDINRGKITEIESLNGYLVKRGAELGIDTPVNQTLYALVKLLEDAVRG